MTFADVQRQSSPRTFPCYVLEGSESAICFFAAAFLGAQDAVHLATAGIEQVVCVDTDAALLDEMQWTYGSAGAGWEWRTADAFEAASTLPQADVVTCDPYTGAAMQRVLDEIETFAALAKKWLVVGSTVDCVAPAPKDFQLHGRVLRSSFRGGTFWTVFKRGT